MIIIPGKRKSLAKRYYANVIDYLILFIIIFVLLFTLGEQTESGSQKLSGVKALIIPFIWFLYFPACESIWGQTLGKKAFHLVVVDLRGELTSVLHTFLRRILDPLEMLLLGIPSILSINFSDKNQRLGDMMAGTTVVYTEAVCRFCEAHVDLSAKEVIHNRFTCPNCCQEN
jgi:uncharacterized RDD family membrane protein YckC